MIRGVCRAELRNVVGDATNEPAEPEEDRKKDVEQEEGEAPPTPGDQTSSQQKK